MKPRLWIGISALLAPGFLTAVLAAQTQLYQVESGDTLSQIAESQYGNWVKWHDLYSVNHDRINDPDLIYPGQRLRLLTDDEINFFREKNGEYASNDDGSSLPRHRGRRSQEWKLLPKQSWENFVFQTPPEIDPQGFDRRSRVPVRVANETHAEATIASDRLAIEGEIVNARTEYSQIFLGEQVFIRADEELQVGTSYSVTNGPQKLSSTRDGRVGFAYDIHGVVRIIGVRDGLFIGTVTKLYAPISRHELLIPRVAPYAYPKAIAAPSAITASVLLSSDVKADMIVEGRLVFLDVGAADGVKPGMIFRHYLHTDPYTGQKISSKDFLIESELQVLSVQDRFSTAIVLHSRDAMRMNDEVVALTDLSDFDKNMGMQTFVQDHGAQNLDDLDLMDNTQGLGEKEDHELRQLENWSNPAPEGSLQPAIDNDEIKRENLNPNSNSVDIGREPAPNDGSTQPLNQDLPPNTDPGAPNTAPDTGTTIEGTGQSPEIPATPPSTEATPEIPPPPSSTEMTPDIPPPPSSTETTPDIPPPPSSTEAPSTDTAPTDLGPSTPEAEPTPPDVSDDQSIEIPPPPSSSDNTTIESSSEDPFAVPEATPVP